MRYLREFICHNQKQLINYEYTISQLHKAFKDSFYEDVDDKPLIEEHYEKLIISSFDMLEDIYSSNIQYIEDVFNSKNNKVRISIKMLLEDKDSLVDIYRNHKMDKKFSQMSVKENSGFNDILFNNKHYYLNDNLEDSFLTNTYKNSRIKESCRKDLKSQKILWKDCWRGYSSDSIEDDEYYQSTLIIPMSIKNTKEDKEKYPLFYKQFFEENKDFEEQRTIFGFLCIDTTKKDYFSQLEEELISPVDYGFIFADILSLYLVFFYNYVVSSETIIEYESNL